MAVALRPDQHRDAEADGQYAVNEEPGGRLPGAPFAEALREGHHPVHDQVGREQPDDHQHGGLGPGEDHDAQGDQQDPAHQQDPPVTGGHGAQIPYVCHGSRPLERPLRVVSPSGILAARSEGISVMARTLCIPRCQLGNRLAANRNGPAGTDTRRHSTAGTPDHADPDPAIRGRQPDRRPDGVVAARAPAEQQGTPRTDRSQISQYEFSADTATATIGRGSGHAARRQVTRQGDRHVPNPGPGSASLPIRWRSGPVRSRSMAGCPRCVSRRSAARGRVPAAPWSTRSVFLGGRAGCVDWPRAVQFSATKVRLRDPAPCAVAASSGSDSAKSAIGGGFATLVRLELDDSVDTADGVMVTNALSTAALTTADIAFANGSGAPRATHRGRSDHRFRHHLAPPADADPSCPSSMPGPIDGHLPESR